MMIQHLQKLLETGEQPYAKICTVHRVHKANKCCDVIPVDGSAELFEVPFHLTEKVDGLCLYPAENTHVLVVFTNKHHACICNISEVDLMHLVIDKMDLSVDKDKFSIKNEEVKFSIDKDGFLLKTKTESLKKLMEELLNAIQAMVFMTPGGSTPAPTTALVNASTFAALQTKFNSLLKD